MKTNKSPFKKNRLVSLAAAILAVLLITTAVLAANGTLDPTFGSGGSVVTDLGSLSDTGNRVGLTSDGTKIYALGSTVQNSIRRAVIVRYNINGSLDSGFDADGRLVIGTGNFSACDFAVQPDGKVVVAGATSLKNFVLLRFLSNGAPDTSFGANGMTIFSLDGEFRFWCKDMVLQPDLKILVFGSEITAQSNHTDFFVARFLADGRLDEEFVGNGSLIIDKSSFPTSQFNFGWAAAVQADGKILLAGGMQDYEGDGQISLARLTGDGQLDKDHFGTNGKGTVIVPIQNFFLYGSFLALQEDGKILVAGTTSDAYEAHRDLVLARLDTDGSLDPSFGVVTTDFGGQEETRSMLLQQDGKIVLLGNISNGTDSQFLLVRYNIDGSLDSSFGSNGKVTTDFGVESAEGAALQVDGKLLAIGTSNADMLVARYDLGPSGAVPFIRVFLSTPVQDGWILESGENTNVGNTRDNLSTTFNVGDDNKDRQYRSILNFQTISLPDNAIIASVQLMIKRQGIVGTDPFKTHGKLLLEVRNGAFSQSIALQAGDFSAPASSTITDWFMPVTWTWYTANLSGTNLAFINLVGVTQFRLRFEKDDNDDMGADYLKFFSGNSISSNRPKLIVTYYLP